MSDVRPLKFSLLNFLVVIDLTWYYVVHVFGKLINKSSVAAGVWLEIRDLIMGPDNKVN